MESLRFRSIRMIRAWGKERNEKRTYEKFKRVYTYKNLRALRQIDISVRNYANYTGWMYRAWPIGYSDIVASALRNPEKETGIGKYSCAVYSPRTRTSTDRWEVKLCLFLAVHVYVPWSAARCTVSMNRLPFATLCLMFVGNLTPSANNVTAQFLSPLVVAIERNLK